MKNYGFDLLLLLTCWCQVHHPIVLELCMLHTLPLCHCNILTPHQLCRNGTKFLSSNQGARQLRLAWLASWPLSPDITSSCTDLACWSNCCDEIKGCKQVLTAFVHLFKSSSTAETSHVREWFWLEGTFKITKPNHQPSSTRPPLSHVPKAHVEEQQPIHVPLVLFLYLTFSNLFQTRELNLSPSDNRESTFNIQYEDVYWNVSGYSLRMGLEWLTCQGPCLYWFDDLGHGSCK